MELRQFRNIEHLRLELHEPRLLVVGPNGEGKSNLLEAVELLCSLRSHRTGSDRDLIRHGHSLSQLQAMCSDGDQLQLELRQRGGRIASRNGKVLERQLDLPGRLRCVTFSALDLDLVRGEPALRRQWLDRVVLQLEPVYGDLLSRYGRLLRQRSQLLRRGGPVTQREDLLDAFDLQMAAIGTRLHRRRWRALRRLEPLAAAWQERLSGGRDQLRLEYRSGTLLEGEDAEAPWREAMVAQLLLQRSEELRLGQCLVGPQRDEIALLLGEQPARRYGSAGQQRTLVLALKLAELALVEEVVGAPPLLLLDDVLAELDPQRQRLLLEAVGEGHQCLVSATHVDGFGEGWRQAAQLVRLRGGSLGPEPKALTADKRDADSLGAESGP
ncbi:DNA replication/repair protein RecF [Synechococcus sp. CCY9202]|uniref:DNA replication/repair protein RecF n=1 Tax=Synechococcus sp. CCY9202 TaxID=174698 RepID=UPI002B213B1D|nr:DNA replication/repair protein RecF [Synechococcus sp. CCY9202]MEA5422443.1 DNA replication/repair protein RecF [Synechococcus sp. CCY9202]